MQENVIFLLRISSLVSFRPIVANGICENLAAGVKTTPRNRIVHLFRCFQLGSSVLVPVRKLAYAKKMAK